MSTAPRSQAVRRDWGHDETGCTVLHIDMDAFYASCEIARHPELKGLPVIIGTGNRAVVSAASYEARVYGVNSAMAVATARRKCPQGVYLPVDMAYYRSVSRQIFSLIASVTDHIERVSVDEAYVDVSAALLRWKRPSLIGQWIRRRVAEDFKVTCSVGIAANKLVAKLASTNAKPDGLLLVPLSQQAAFVQLLPLRSLPGIGPASAERFRRGGIETVAGLAELSEEDIARLCGSKAHAHGLWLAARGRDEHPVTPHTPEKSIGAERTFAEDTRDFATVAALLHHCGDEVSSSLRRRGLLAHTLTVKIRFDDLSYATKALTLPTLFDSAAVLVPTATNLLRAMLKLGEAEDQLPRPVRLAGLSASGLSPAGRTALQPALDLGDAFDDLAGAGQRPPRSDGRAQPIDGRQTAGNGERGQQTDPLGSSEPAEPLAPSDRPGRPGKTTPARSSHRPVSAQARREKLRTAEQALDSIRSKYGKTAVSLGAVHSPIHRTD